MTSLLKVFFRFFPATESTVALPYHIPLSLQDNTTRSITCAPEHIHAKTR